MTANEFYIKLKEHLKSLDLNQNIGDDWKLISNEKNGYYTFLKSEINKYQFNLNMNSTNWIHISSINLGIRLHYSHQRDRHGKSLHRRHSKTDSSLSPSIPLSVPMLSHSH